MNAKTLIEALKPLEGHTIYVVSKYMNYAMPCFEVTHLPPNQRVEKDQGNVLLWKGTVTPDGVSEGLTVWARDVERVEERNGMVVVIVKGGGRINFTLAPLDSG